MKNALIAGASGMVGGLVSDARLASLAKNKISELGSATEEPASSAPKQPARSAENIFRLISRILDGERTRLACTLGQPVPYEPSGSGANRDPAQALCLPISQNTRPLLKASSGKRTEPICHAF